MTLIDLTNFMERQLSSREVAGLKDTDLERLEGELYRWHRLVFQECCRRDEKHRETWPGGFSFAEGAGHD